MTTVTIIGEDFKQPEKKGIEFVQLVTCRIGAKIFNPDILPQSFKFIELISRAASVNYYDAMFCHNGERATGVIMLGHFNDGVVK